MATSVVGGPDVVVDLRDRDAGADAPPTDDRRRRGIDHLHTALAVAAVLVPVLLFGWRALRAPVNFDGAMNLQVASRLAAGDGYTRFYGAVEDFPHEVQTNGPYIYAAALGIEVFGHGQLGLQFANLLFVAGFAATVVLLLREHRWVRAVAPTVVLVAVPWIGTYALGGLGEVPTTSFLFLAVLGLAGALRAVDAAPERVPWWVLGAGAAFGAALATKTFAVGAAAALGAGFACVLTTVPTWWARLRLAAVAAAGAALLPLVRELHKLIALGSVGEYKAWWDVERSAASEQSGFEETGGGIVRTFLDHTHVLSDQLTFPAELLVVVLFLPVAWVAGVALWRWRQEGWRAAARDPRLVVLLMLAGLVAFYVGWWLCLLPESKLWVRRMLPGLLALHVLYAFMVPWLVGMLRGIRGRATVIGAAFGVLVVAGATVLPYGRDRIDDGLSDIRAAQPEWLAADQDAADLIRSGDDDLRWYGDGWWSAPAVGLMARTDLRDLSETDPCDLDPARDRLVWDFDALGISGGGPSTRDGDLAFDEVAAFGGYVRIYSVGPGPGRCPGTGSGRVVAGR